MSAARDGDFFDADAWINWDRYFREYVELMEPVFDKWGIDRKTALLLIALNGIKNVVDNSSKDDDEPWKG